MIVGVDEVGRGCLAGPVCVAAVAQGDEPVAVNDSKVLGAGKRQSLAGEIRRTAVLIGIGWAPPAYIDTHGITAALKLAARRALRPFGTAPELVLLDGNYNYIEDERVVTVINGDASVMAIAAASIIAKVARDNYMGLAAKRFERYGFEKHVGYGTAAHLQALQAYGPCSLHRLSFAPLKGKHVH
jgi:ribonuclease HII